MIDYENSVKNENLTNDGFSDYSYYNGNARCSSIKNNYEDYEKTGSIYYRRDIYGETHFID